ncbi:hypothetical protein Zm00014a_029570 [Zea mays]|uniref:Uncharacterized protein n=1 Tax=Zea mays TaxID=4577 RepID=A0A317YGM7_MAIZE|nr:hypothetical protein Zm00014a_029570 [Zea mays]
MPPSRRSATSATTPRRGTKRRGWPLHELLFRVSRGVLHARRRRNTESGKPSYLVKKRKRPPLNSYLLRISWVLFFRGVE